MADEYGSASIVDFDDEEVRLSMANAGDALAQFFCGWAAGDEGNYQEAAYWYEKAAANENQAGMGVGDAKLRLGTMYFKGEGVPQDLARAYAWYQKVWREGGFPLILALRDYRLPLIPGESIYKGHIEQNSGDFATEYGRVRFNHGGGQKDIPRLFTLRNEGGAIWAVTYKSGEKVKILPGESFVISEAENVDFGGCVGVISEYGKEV
jgi:hypothetical protein